MCKATAAYASLLSLSVGIEAKDDASGPNVLLDETQRNSSVASRNATQKAKVTYAVEHRGRMVVVVVVPKAARRDAHILQSLLPNKRLHDDLVPRGVAFAEDPQLHGVGDRCAPGFPIGFVVLLTIEFFLEALGDDIAHFLPAKAVGDSTGEPAKKRSDAGKKTK